MQGWWRGRRSEIRKLGLIPLALTGLLLTSACEKPKPAAAPGPEVVVAPVEKKDVQIYSEWIGSTTGYVNAQIHPKVQGYLLRQAYQDGALVHAGDLLFEVDPRQFQAALDQALGQLGRAQAALGKSELDVKRFTPLAAEGAVSQKELDDAVQARAANAAEVASASAAVEQARLNLGWTKIHSPVSGIAAIATAQIGDLVGPTTLLTTVSQLDPIKVTFPISEIEYLRFASRIDAQAAGSSGADDVPLELVLANGSTYPHPGRFSVAGLAVSETMGTINMQGLFPNTDNLLRPGQYAKVRVATERLPGALVIPQRAVRDLQGVHQVAVLGAGDEVHFRAVKLGPPTGSEYVVESGLSAGDRIVIEGLQKIRDGMVVRLVTQPAAAKASAAPSPEAARN